MAKKTVKRNEKNLSDEELIEQYNKFKNALENPETTMTKEMLKDIKKKMYESLSIDRQKLVTRQPFTGGMLMRLNLVPVRDYRCPTAQTDGRNIYFDISFYKELSEGERLFVLAHECWHCVYLHFLRKHQRISSLWNIATDCEINYMLKGEGFEHPADLCYPEQEDEGKSAEQIYERILKKLKKQGKSNGGNDGDSGYCGTGYGESNKKSSSDEDNDKPKSKSKRLKDQFDRHTEKNKKDGSSGDEGDGDGEEDGNGQNGGFLPKDEWGEIGEDQDYHPMIDQDAAERIREAVISEAQKIERTQGKLPGGLTSILNHLRKPEINWKTLLATEITKVFTDKKSWLPPSRRHVWEEMYFQSRRGERVKVSVVIDTSGSTTADLPKFMGEVVSLLNSFSNYEMEFIQCDADIQSVETYDDNNPFPVEDCSKVKFKGFGGSDFTPVFKHFEKKFEQPNLVVFFTDGYITTPKDPPPYEVVWILTSDANGEVASYGKKIFFKEKIRDEDY